MSELKDKCVKWIRDWFDENGKDCNAIIGISGGKDSTVAAALCVEALGKDRVIGVLMPNYTQDDIEDSYSIVNHLGIKYIPFNIGSITSSFNNKIVGSFIVEQSGAVKDIEISKLTGLNLPSRIRMVALYAISQSLNGRVCNTCNRSEIFLGYSTLWGDDVGDFSPLGNLTCREVIALGDELELPAEFVHKAPSDGLCGKSDEDSLGFTYDEVDEYLINKEKGKHYEAIMKRHENTKFKQVYKVIPTFSISENE